MEENMEKVEAAVEVAERPEDTNIKTKINKKLFAILGTVLAAVVVGIVLLIVLLPGDSGSSEPQFLDYEVLVVDEIGTPISNIIVKFIDENGVTKTKVTDKTGIAKLENVLAGNYTVLLDKGFSETEIIISEYSLTADKTSITARVKNSANVVEIFGVVDEGTTAAVLSAGDYSICLEASKTSYYVFYAPSSGTYKVSCVPADDSVTVGFYGIPMFIQDHHIGDGPYDGKTFDLIIHDFDTPYTLGVTSENAGDVTLKIERTGDAPFDPSYAPWTVVNATATLTQLTLPAGTTLRDIDITDANLSVTLGDDGYYHTSDGKIVYLRLNSISDANYLDVSFAFIAGFVDENHGQNFGGFVYDDAGNFVGKYSYNSMIESYLQYCDRGVYPLTEELAEAVKLHGQNAGWWNPASGNYLFSNVLAVLENAWLFACCTAE